LGAEYKGKSIANWISDLSSDGLECTDAVAALVEAGKLAVPELAQNLQNTNTEIRKMIPLVLGKIGSEAHGAISSLEQVCNSNNKIDAIGARYALIMITNEEGSNLSAIAEDLESENGVIRRNAALTLKMLGIRAKPVGERIFNMVRREAVRGDTDQLAYNYASDALKRIGGPHPF